MRCAQDPVKALAAYDPAVHDVVLTDFSIPPAQRAGGAGGHPGSGGEDAVVVIITGYGNEELAADFPQGRNLCVFV